MRSASAASPATSGARMAASLPPSSSTTGLVVAAAAAITAWPVPTPPVKETMSTPGWPTSAAPRAAVGPFTTLRTPGGSTSAMAAATRSTVPGHEGGALTTTVSPGQQCGQHFVAHDGDGPVEGQDGGDDAVGDPLDPGGPAAEVTRRQGLGHQRCEGRRHAAHGGGVEDRLEVGLAMLPGEEAGQVAALGGCNARLGGGDDQRGAVLGFQRGPGSLRPAGGGHGQVELGRRGGRRIGARPRPGGPGSSPDRCRRRRRPRRRR